MRVAIIDLGTNSVRFDIHQIGPKNQVRLLHREKLMVRLGQGVFTEGRLNPEAIRRTLQAFTSFKSTAEELRASRIVAFGTAALREASDGLKLLNTIRAKTGIELRIISGAEEAKFISLGILENEKLPKGRFGLIDIGGGSTEISVCRGKKQLRGHSFPLGTARLQQVFLRSSPPKPAFGSNENPVEHLRKYVRSTLLTKMLADSWPKMNPLVGSSGTVRAIARIVNKNGKKKNGAKSIERGALKKLVKEMSTMTTTELLGLPGMEAKRVDMILAGAILLEECMNVTGAKKTIATDFSLRDGILEEQIQLVKSQKESSLGLHMAEVRARVAIVKRDMAITEEIARYALQIFDGLKGLHKLGPEWRSLLEAAALLHDIGEFVSPTNHEEHSYYIVKNADYIPLEKWESEFIARLCLYHRVGKPELPELGRGEKTKKQAFLRLLAILRVAVAIDRGQPGFLRIKKLRILRGKIELVVQSKTAPDLELLRVDQKKGLFEVTFKRPLKIVSAKK